MKLTKHYQLGIVFFIISIMFFLGCAYLCNLQFFGSTPGNPSFSKAMICAIPGGVGIILLLLALIKFFHESRVIDDRELDKDIEFKFKFKKSGLFTILILLGIFSFKKIGNPMIELYNTNIVYTNELDKVQQERIMFYDKMWKTYLSKNDICELNRETFIEVTSIIMQGRSDGVNVSWKFVHENQNIPFDEFKTFYVDLSQFVTSQREAYYRLETQCMDIVRKQNALLDIYPNNIYNKVLNLEKLEYSPGFTSIHTQEIFNSKEENF